MFVDKPMIIYFVSLDKEVVYIGQTRLSLAERRKQHEYNARRGKGYIIGAAIRKHGPNKFSWAVHSVHFCQQDLNDAERTLIAKYAPKYNINLGGEARGIRKSSGKPPWNKGKTGAQIAWNKGRKETRTDVLQHISDSAKCRDVSSRMMTEAHKQAIQTGRREKYRKDSRSFICHENKKTYNLVVDAAKDLDIPAGGIYAVLNPHHRMKSYKGFTFSYIDR